MARTTNRPILKPYLKKTIDLVGGQKELAELIDVSPSTISYWLYSDTKIPKDKCDRIESITHGKIKKIKLRPELKYAMQA